MMDQKNHYNTELDYEERYLRLREDYNQIQVKNNEQEACIRRLNTKLSQIESNLKLKQRMDGTGIGVRNKENEELITELYRINNELASKNKSLESRNKGLNMALAKKTRECESVKKELAL